MSFPEFHEGEKAKLAKAALILAHQIHYFFNRDFEEVYKFRNPRVVSEFIKAHILYGLYDSLPPAKTPFQLESSLLPFSNSFSEFFYNTFFLDGLKKNISDTFNGKFYSDLLEKFSSNSSDNYEIQVVFRKLGHDILPSDIIKRFFGDEYTVAISEEERLVPIISTAFFSTDSDYTIVLRSVDGEKPFFLGQLGFYIYEDALVVNQIQGISVGSAYRILNNGTFDKANPYRQFRRKYSEAMKNIKWSKVLLGTIVNIAEEFKLKLKVISAQNHILTKIPGHLSYGRAGMIYNATAKALGFKKDVDGNYILSF